MNKEQGANLAQENIAFNESRGELFTKSKTQTYKPKDFSNQKSTDANYQTEVTKEGCIAACTRIYKESNTAKIGLLNFASAKHPGGGYLRGARAQEEDICLKTDLYHYLKEEKAFYNTSKFKDSPGYYKDELLYTKGVAIIRNENYTLLDDFIPIDVVTCAAPNRSVQKLDSKMAEKGLEIRIHMILDVFIKEGCSHLILGAFGCGIFKNDPKLVAALFDTALKQKAVNGFKIVFAVKTNKDNDPNYSAFRKQFS